MEHGFRFRKWDVYTDARAYRKWLHAVLQQFPSDERFALVDQARRAMSSVILNIAERSNCRSDKDTRLYIDRSRSSLDEVVACMDCALDSGYIDAAVHEKVLEYASRLAKRLMAFSMHLSKHVNRK